MEGGRREVSFCLPFSSPRGMNPCRDQRRETREQKQEEETERKEAGEEKRRVHVLMPSFTEEIIREEELLRELGG